MKKSCTAAIFLSFTLQGLAEKPDVQGYRKLVAPLIESYCMDCHDDDTSKGDISLEGIQGNLVDGPDLAHWEKVLHQVELGQMPPKKKPQPTTAERHSLVQWIRAEFLKGGRKPENKLLRPGAGNYVKHERLFGDEDFGPAWSPPRIWRIRPSVYESGIRAVAKNGKYVRPFTLKSGGHGFRDYDNQYRLAGADLSQLMANTATAAKQLTEVRLSNGKTSKGNSTPTQLFDLIHPADAPPTEEQVDAAIQWLFDRVLLRSPTPEEQARFQTFAMQSMKSDGKLLGVRNLISAVLLKPEALYRSELAQGEPDEHGRVLLAPREIAYALAYALTDTRPDAELLKAASTGKLATNEEVAAQIRRMLEDPKLQKPRILGFFREYFEYGGAIDVFKDEALNRNHVPEVLVSDTDRLILHFYEQDKDVLRELLTTNKSFVQYGINSKTKKPTRAQARNLGAHLAYSLPPDWKWVPEQPIALPGSQRAGILTQPAWLVAKSGNFDNDAIQRGLWVRGKLLGGIIPDLPITVDAQLPNDETLTLREKMKVTEEAYCWKCHQNTNPVGLPFEMFDHFGRWRTKELGKPVDTTGAITNSGVQGLDAKVSDAVAMLHRLADSPRVRQVFVRHAFRYFMGRNETLHDASTLRQADQVYVKSGGSMKSLIISLLTSDSFLYRKAKAPNG
jgi:hypothetical protein